MWNYATGEKFQAWMWFACSACDCEETGWVCGYCGGSKWVKQGEFGKAMPCPACCEIQDNGMARTVVREQWWVDFVRLYGKSKEGVAVRRDRTAEYTDRAERNDARRAFRAKIVDELQSEDDSNLFEEPIEMAMG